MHVSRRQFFVIFPCPCAQVLRLVVGGGSSALSAAKRYRLRCLKPLILVLAGGQAIYVSVPELLTYYALCVWVLRIENLCLRF